MSNKLVLVPQFFIPHRYYFHPEAEKLIFSEFLIQEVFPRSERFHDHLKKLCFLREYIEDHCPILVNQVEKESWAFVSNYRVQAVPSPSSFVILTGGSILRVSNSSLTTPPSHFRVWHI